MNSSMTEKQLLTDLLNDEKSLVKDYASYVTEAACHNLRRLLTLNMIECSQDQYEVFEQMNQRNMYPIKNATTQEVQQAQQKAQTLKQETGL